MIKSIFTLVLLSLMVFPVSSIIHAQTNIEVESEVETEVGVEIETESSASIESQTKGEVKTETKTKDESNSSQASQKSEAKSEAKTEMKTSVGNIAVSAKGDIAASVGLPTKYPMPAVSAKSSVGLQTNQHLYKPGDSVSIQGSLWTELLSGSNNNIVTIKVFDKTKNVIYDVDTQITADGTYSTEFSLHPDAAKGSYTVTVELDSNVTDPTGIKIQSSVGSSTKIVVVPPHVFKIDVKDHGNFDVKVATNSTVNSVKFDGEEKKVSVVVEGQSGTKGVSHISIPKSMVSGNMKIMIDGELVANDKTIVTANTETETEIEISYEHSIHTIDVIGTQAIPEFGTITVMVLMIALVSIIAISTKSRISIMPKV